MKIQLNERALRKIWRSILMYHQEERKKESWKAIEQKIESGYEVPGYIDLPDSQRRIIHFRPIQFARVAAAVILVFGMGILFRYTLFNKPVYSVVENTYQHPKEYSLADGSMIALNTGAEIKIPRNFNKNNREIYFSGEAFFEIEKNKKKPFIIHTDMADIKVLGTSFNVKYDTLKQLVTVNVVSGSVQLSDGIKPGIILYKGESGMYNSQLGSFSKTKHTDQNFLAWKTGILQFKDKPVKEVLTDIEDYYHIPVILRNDSIKDVKFTDSFDNQPLENVIYEFELLLNVECLRKNDTLYIR